MLAVNCSVPTSVMLLVELCHRMLTYLWSSTSYSSVSLLLCLCYRRLAISFIHMLLVCSLFMVWRKY